MNEGWVIDSSFLRQELLYQYDMPKLCASM